MTADCPAGKQMQQRGEVQGLTDPCAGERVLSPSLLLLVGN